MRTDSILFGVMVLAIIGVIFVGMRPKACIDKITGAVRWTHRLFPCKSNEVASLAVKSGETYALYAT
jgi:hypothetical protein